MIQNIGTSTPELRLKARELAKQVFETEHHPDYIEASDKSVEMLKSLSLDSILYEVGESGELRGWTVVIPTSKDLMDKFIKKEITEMELLEMSKAQTVYPTLYFCAAATIPDFRRKGIAINLMKEAFHRIPLTSDYELFGWPVSPEGFSLIRKFEEETGKIVHIRQ